MKTVFALIALSVLMVFAAHAEAATLIESVRNPGFVSNPEVQRFKLEDTGRMSLEIKSFRADHEPVVVELGQLSPAGVASIQTEIEAIDENAKLVDKQAGQPRCTDAPSASTTVVRKGVAKVISRFSGCHVFELDTNQGSGLVGFTSVFFR